MKGLGEGGEGKEVAFFKSIRNNTRENCTFRCQPDTSANLHWDPFWIQREKQVSSHGTSLLCNLYGRHFTMLKLVEI